MPGQYVEPLSTVAFLVFILVAGLWCLATAVKRD